MARIQSKIIDFIRTCLVAPGEGNASALVAAVGALAIAGLLFFTFSHNEHCLYSGSDGTWYRVLFRTEAVDRTPFVQTGVDALSGSFDAYYPLQREYLPPSAIAMFLGQAQLSRGMTYFMYSLILLAAVYAIGRAVRVERAVALTAAFLMTILAPPGFINYPSQFYYLFELNPHWFQTTALACFAVAAFWALDGRAGWRMAALALVPTLCLGLAILGVAPQVIFMVPAMAAYGAGSLLSAKHWRDNRWRLLAGALMIGIPLLLGVATYYHALIDYTAFHFFGNEIGHPMAGKLGLSNLFWYFPLARWSIILGIAGAFTEAVLGKGKLRVLAFTHLVATVLFFIIGGWLAFYAVKYRGSFPIYFETAIWPFATLFATLLIARAVRLVLGLTALIPITRWLSRYAGAVVLAAAFLWIANDNIAEAIAGGKDCKGWTTPATRSTPISTYLEKEIALTPGIPFRGMVATIGGFANGKRDWVSMAGSDHRLWEQTGNDHRFDGLWRFNIPTLFSNSTFITPPYYTVLTDFLSQPTDHQLRSSLVLTGINAPMMRLWGVRYLITDDPTDAGKQVLAMPAGDRGTLHLTELSDPNLGDYSPTEVENATDFHAGLQIMHQPSFDGARQVVSDAQVVGTLVPATGARLTYEKYGFRLVAKSAGTSVLVLPVQYSHCWTANGPGAPSLFRADLMQLGVRFSAKLDVRLTFRFGPVLASSCRLEDLRDMDRLRIQNARSVQWRSISFDRSR